MESSTGVYHHFNISLALSLSFESNDIASVIGNIEFNPFQINKKYIMSSDSCFFTLKGSEIGIDEIRKDQCISILVPLDTDEPDGLKPKEEIQKLLIIDPKKILTFLLMFNEKVSDLEIAEGNPRFHFFERLLYDSVKIEWRIVRNNYESEDNGQYICDQCISDFTGRFMTEQYR